MKAKERIKRAAALALCLVTALSLALPAAAAEIKYMPDVTEEMSDAAYWAKLHEDAGDLILTPEEIEAFNEDTYIASGTMVMDLRTIKESFDGRARNEAIRRSATADAEYYFGWTYGPDGEKAEWSYYEEMIDNCIDRKATRDMSIRYAVAVERTTLQVFPTEDPIWDDPADHDFNYQYLSAVQVNDPLVLYTTSGDGNYYLARSRDCSGWIPAEDVAVCADREEWLSAWDLPSEQLLVVYGNKEYTDESFTAPETARRMLAQGTRLELVSDLEPDQLVNNRSAYHNYAVYLPVRAEDGSYEKKMALIPETAKVSVGFLPLTMENIAMVMLNNLGDAYGWGGMMGVEDCSGLIRTVYACFGLEIGRNGNWQWNMNIEKIDMANMSTEEKLLILDELPLGAALCFPGHEMMYLGKENGKYYVISTVSSIMSPETGKRLRTRDVMINTLDVKRANGQTWLQALNMAFMPCYAELEGKSYDFPQLQWYHDAVAYCLKNKLMDSGEGGYFGLHDLAVRAEAVSALWRLEGRPQVQPEEVFADVSAQSKDFTAVHWARENGIAGGYAATLFGGENAITHEQLMTMLWRYAQFKGYDVSVGEDTNILSYDDAFAVAQYALPAMQWACGAGVQISRTGADGKPLLAPQSEVTRVQLATALMEFDAWMQQAEFVPHVFDLAVGEMIISAGAEEYSAYAAADPAPGKAPAPAYVSQDGGATWTELKGDIIVVSSEETKNGISIDFEAPYGDLTVILDGVHTTGDLILSPDGATTLQVRGEACVGTVVTGLGQTLTVRGAEDGTGTLRVNSPDGYGIIAGGDIRVEGLSLLEVHAAKDGIYTEQGSISIDCGAGTVQAGEGFAALTSGDASAEITVNAAAVTMPAGSSYTVGG